MYIVFGVEVADGADDEEGGQVAYAPRQLHNRHAAGKWKKRGQRDHRNGKSKFFEVEWCWGSGEVGQRSEMGEAGGWESVCGMLRVGPVMVPGGNLVRVHGQKVHRLTLRSAC